MRFCAAVIRFNTRSSLLAALRSKQHATIRISCALWLRVYFAPLPAKCAASRFQAAVVLHPVVVMVVMVMVVIVVVVMVIIAVHGNHAKTGKVISSRCTEITLPVLAFTRTSYSPLRFSMSIS